ncbi:MAG: HAMP domain-containing sensor histidine kinase, partial [Campylobacterota bacterium]|nr:HAMP domain-containing sensor histidine kinase [Campylobacterota bacterium]
DIIVLELSLTLLPSKNAFISVINSLEDKLELEKLNKNLKVKIDDAIEESKLKNAILFQSSKMAAMGEMIDSIAHQWMQPIGVIGMKLQTLELDIELNKITEKRIKDVVETSEKQIQHLINTINEFRKFFRPNSRVERVSIKELIDSTILLMQDSLIKNNINIKLNGDIDILIDTNPSEFKHIFINLINNSQDAFNENKIDEHDRDIIFYIKKIDNKTSITISDNAGGIPKDIINNIFEPNFTTKTKGTGIGLYMTKQIINKNNSTINVKTIDNGTAFNILINS